MGVSLITTAERTIAGVEFPLLCHVRLKWRVCGREPQVFNYDLKALSDRGPLSQVARCVAKKKQKQKHGVPFREHVGRNLSESHLFGMFYGNRWNSHCCCCCCCCCTSVTLKLSVPLLSFQPLIAAAELHVRSATKQNIGPTR